MTYSIESMNGDSVLALADGLGEAIITAKRLLSQDPELRSVEVYQADRYIGEATHIPTRDFDTTVGFLFDGERIGNPHPTRVTASGEHHVTGFEGYELDDPKHSTFVERMAEYIDTREE